MLLKTMIVTEYSSVYIDGQLQTSVIYKTKCNKRGCGIIPLSFFFLSRIAPIYEKMKGYNVLLRSFGRCIPQLYLHQFCRLRVDTTLHGQKHNLGKGIDPKRDYITPVTICYIILLPNEVDSPKKNIYLVKLGLMQTIF